MGETETPGRSNGTGDAPLTGARMAAELRRPTAPPRAWYSAIADEAAVASVLVWYDVRF